MELEKALLTSEEVVLEMEKTLGKNLWTFLYTLVCWMQIS